jgi:hypothetical protein
MRCQLPSDIFFCLPASTGSRGRELIGGFPRSSSVQAKKISFLAFLSTSAKLTSIVNLTSIILYHSFKQEF